MNSCHFQVHDPAVFCVGWRNSAGNKKNRKSSFQEFGLNFSRLPLGLMEPWVSGCSDLRLQLSMRCLSSQKNKGCLSRERLPLPFRETTRPQQRNLTFQQEMLEGQSDVFLGRLWLWSDRVHVSPCRHRAEAAGSETAASRLSGRSSGQKLTCLNVGPSVRSED